MLNAHLRPPNARAAQRGLSMVELMVGVAVGLFVVAGATVAVSNQLGDNRRLTLEMQVQQDLRAAADLIARDIRRSGYWGGAASGVWFATGGPAASNPYTGLTPAVSGTAASAVTFAYSRGAENDARDAADEAGFRLNGNTGAIDMFTGGGWQALTDSNTLRVTNFQIRLDSQDIALACFKACGGAGPACPTQTVRDVTIEINGQAVHDASVQRTARTKVRLRNDVISGTCPT
jgi:type IV pilus assembly protein PilW